MADGKVMQKYYPPDFDPEALKRNKDVLRAIQRQKVGGGKRTGRRMMEMRMMFPFTLQCENCKDFVYVGTKFNSKVEKVRGQDYLGIAIWRFYGRCPHCRHQLVMRTDPKNTDYVLESGGIRTYDSNRDVKLAEEALEQAKQQEVDNDTVKALEVKSYSAAGELKTLEALEELKRLNKRLMGRPDKLSEFTQKVLDERAEKANDALDEAELREARDLFREREFGPSNDDSGTDDDDNSDLNGNVNESELDSDDDHIEKDPNCNNSWITNPNIVTLGTRSRQEDPKVCSNDSRTALEKTLDDFSNTEGTDDDILKKRRIDYRPSTFTTKPAQPAPATTGVDLGLVEYDSDGSS